MTITEIISTISVWTAPPLFSAVLFFIIRHYNNTDESIKSLKKGFEVHIDNMSRKTSAIEDKVNKTLSEMTHDFNQSAQMLLDIQSQINKEIFDINKLSYENSIQVNVIGQWIEIYKESHGKVVYMENMMRKHDRDIIKANELLSNQNSDIEYLKKHLNKAV